eukprot:5327296-Amphidinium_carterae.1
MEHIRLSIGAMDSKTERLALQRVQHGVGGFVQSVRAHSGCGDWQGGRPLSLLLEASPRSKYSWMASMAAVGADGVGTSECG